MTGNCPKSPVDLYDVTATVAGSATTYPAVSAKVCGSLAVTKKRFELRQAGQSPRHAFWSVSPLQSSGYAQPGATHFDGIGGCLRRTSPFIGLVNGGKGTITGWVKPTAGNAINTVMENVGAWFGVGTSVTSGTLEMYVFGYDDPVGNLVVQGQMNVPAYVPGNWYSYGISWDIQNSLLTGYVNGVNTSFSSVVLSYFGAPITYISPDGDQGFLSNAELFSPPTFANFSGDNCKAEVWMDLTRYVDFTNAVNIHKFVTSSNAPVDLGADGSTPFGTPPIFYCKKMDGVNVGSGGSMTQFGGPGSCGTHP